MFCGHVKHSTRNPRGQRNRFFLAAHLIQEGAMALRAEAVESTSMPPRARKLAALSRVLVRLANILRNLGRLRISEGIDSAEALSASVYPAEVVAKRSPVDERQYVRGAR